MRSTHTEKSVRVLIFTYLHLSPQSLCLSPSISMNSMRTLHHLCPYQNLHNLCADLHLSPLSLWVSPSISTISMHILTISVCMSIYLCGYLHLSPQSLCVSPSIFATSVCISIYLKYLYVYLNYLYVYLNYLCVYLHISLHVGMGWWCGG
jgi:hypothetical protein